VILINLLPHREAARKKRQDIFNISLGASALAGGVIAGLMFLWLQTEISSQQRQNTILVKENKRLDDQIKDIAALESEIAALRARQLAVENLQADRNMPVHLLTELVKQFPEGIYIASMRQDNQLVTLQGVAQSNERVAELLRNLAYNTSWFEKPELIEIVAASITLGAREQRRVFNFIMRVRLVRTSEAQKAQPGAKAASAAASAVLAPQPLPAAASMPVSGASMPVKK
jgi:type IV pilus assembly protein PilN